MHLLGYYGACACAQTLRGCVLTSNVKWCACFNFETWALQPMMFLHWPMNLNKSVIMSCYLKILSQDFYDLARTLCLHSQQVCDSQFPGRPLRAKEI